MMLSLLRPIQEKFTIELHRSHFGIWWQDNWIVAFSLILYIIVDPLQQRFDVNVLKCNLAEVHYQIHYDTMLVEVRARLAGLGATTKKKLEKKRRLDRGKGSSGAVRHIQVDSALSFTYKLVTNFEEELADEKRARKAKKEKVTALDADLKRNKGKWRR
ncbi:uncharacterized protein A4U43_C09F6080 [Asparagus officinalis]|uniref:Uncharacterized protein n=1 Tax=Asparagus officinalis TaxID=4686 RepID=A0A5P1E8X7_ASPOF|nr:uncharacterized protein A4U43_C09F6080 [Asparagus officinalis]